MGSIYGYIRVSAKDQNEERQRVAMLEQGINPDHLYIDKQSGKDFDRPAYQKLVEDLQPGDVIFAASIDRLGRDYHEILEQWRYLAHEKKVHLVILDMPLLDTRQEEGLLGTFISDLVLQLLSFVAQTERENIRSRQREGIAVARQKGVHLGRPCRKLPPEFDEACRLWLERTITATEAARRCNMPVSTFRYHAEKKRESQN
ncbi:MAG: recombinase family protein [Lachnospiraceae bacterium]|nr:recombinase family protein [Lachnospiraceae bacterium]